MATAAAFEKLNPRQREAASAGSAPLLIIAGAGTGKTNTLAHRVAHLVLQGAQPERILLLTFTRRAALEMTRRANRIVAQVKKEVRLPWSGTFHSVANRLIRKYSKRIGLADSFSVLDRGDAADLMDVVRHERGLSKSEKRFPRKDTCLAIYSHKVNTQRPLGETIIASLPPRLRSIRPLPKKSLQPEAGTFSPRFVQGHPLSPRQRHRSGHPGAGLMARFGTPSAGVSKKSIWRPERPAE